MKKAVFALTLCCATSLLAWDGTSDNEWRSGWGQGISEAQVTQGSGNEIYVACVDEDDERYSSVSVVIGGEGPGSGDVLMSFDRGSLEAFPFDENGLLEAASRVHDQYFQILIQQLRKHNSVYVRFADGREAVFTLKGSAKAIGDCRGFW